jgi:peptidoglycan/xylan/chitin deacetylase (PgdA/CDA1 family)
MLEHKAVRIMVSSRLIEFGAHTHTHAILGLLSEEEQAREIRASLSSIEELTNRNCRFFAYPNGQPQDYNTTTMRLLRIHRIQAAMTGNPNPNDRTTPALELRRYGIGCDTTFAYFKLKVHHLIAHGRRLRELASRYHIRTPH